MNSFRFVERGIAAEIERQREILDAGGKVEQETLHFDPRTGELTPLRSKEYSHDYRYFPEPDLVPLAPTEDMLDAARAALPELPAERRERYAGARPRRGAPRRSSPSTPSSATTSRQVAAGGRRTPSARSSRTGSPASSPRRSPTGERRRPPEPANLGATIAMVQGKQISHGAARQLLRLQVLEDSAPEALAEREGLAGVRGVGRAGGDRRGGDRGRPRRRRQGPRRQHEGRWAAGGIRHARDQGARGRWRGDSPDSFPAWPRLRPPVMKR